MTEPQTAELIVLACLTNTTRCREINGGPVTYRRNVAGLIPGQRLTVEVVKRWTFRKSDMIGGPLLHAGFALRALTLAGYALPTLDASGAAPVMRSPGDDDPRLAEARAALDAGQWPVARCLLLDVLEAQPASLPAHALMARLLSDLEHREAAMLHATAAVRLGLGASCSVPMDACPAQVVPLDWCGALVTRARLLADLGRTQEAATDLHRARVYDPADRSGAVAVLHALPVSA